MRFLSILCMLCLVLAVSSTTTAQPLHPMGQSATSTDVLSGYAVQETISIPLNGSVVTSKTFLQAGIHYTIRAIGIAVAGGPGFTDAEYGFNAWLASPIDTCANGIDFGLAINNPTVVAEKTPFWGNFTASHIYAVDVVGTNQAISLNYHDCAYGDNAGSLTVEILVPSPGIAIETLSLPLDGKTVTSATVLEENSIYTVRTIGIAVAGGPGFTDAEYGFNAALSQVLNRCVSNGLDFGVSIDDPTIALTKSAFWGLFTSSHV